MTEFPIPADEFDGIPDDRRPDTTKADRVYGLIQRHIKDRDASPFDTITEIHEAFTQSSLDDEFETGPEPGSLTAVMQG